MKPSILKRAPFLVENETIFLGFSFFSCHCNKYIFRPCSVVHPGQVQFICSISQKVGQSILICYSILPNGVLVKQRSIAWSDVSDARTRSYSLYKRYKSEVENSCWIFYFSKNIPDVTPQTSQQSTLTEWRILYMKLHLSFHSFIFPIITCCCL